MKIKISLLADRIDRFKTNYWDDLMDGEDEVLSDVVSRLRYLAKKREGVH